jgi:hypothetical protein
MAEEAVSVNITNIRQFDNISLREKVSRALRAAIVSGAGAGGRLLGTHARRSLRRVGDPGP